MAKLTRKARSYTLNGRKVSLGAFLRDNRDGLSASELKRIRAMRSGDTVTLGGGAGPLFLLKRQNPTMPRDRWVSGKVMLTKAGKVKIKTTARALKSKKR